MHQYIQVHRTEIREFYIQQEHCVLLTRQHVADGFDPSGVWNSLLQMGTLKTKGQAIVNRLNMRYQCARTTVFAALSDRCRQTDTKCLPHDDTTCIRTSLVESNLSWLAARREPWRGKPYRFLTAER